MYRLYKKNELNFSLVWIISYVVLFSVADSFSASLGTEKIIAAVAEFKKRESNFIRNSGILKYYAIQQLSKKLIDEISFSFFENFSPSNINDLKQQGNYAKKLVETNKLAKKRVEAELDAMRILKSVCDVEVKEKMRKIDDAVSERTFLKNGISFNFEKETDKLCKFVNS